MSPVTLGIDVAEVQAALLAERDVRHSPGDLACDERASTPRALVVEQDAVARIHPVRLAVVDHDPVRIQLRHAVRAAGVERRRLRLGRLDDLAVELGGRGLVEADVLLEPAGPDGVQQTEGAEAVDVAGVFGHLEGDLDVRLGAEVVDLGGLDVGDDVDQVGRVGEIAIVKLELVRAWIEKSIKRKGGDQ
jgi:hypothetical protein